MFENDKCVKMHIEKPQLVTLFSLCLFLASVHLPRITASGDRNQAQLQGSNDGTLLIEAATDQNITFRLMGEAATLLLNDVDIVSLLQMRRQASAVQSGATQREPLSLDALKEQFRSVQSYLTRLGVRLRYMNRGTRRSRRLTFRIMKRIRDMEITITSLESDLEIDECLSSPCKNGGTCYDEYKAFYCSCSAAWQGLTCEDDVDECSEYAGTALAVCYNDAQCINTPGSYRCNCRTGFYGTHCRLRQNACLANQSAELCGSHGTCLPAASAGGFVCICDQGWTWADTNVTTASASPCTRDVNECSPDVNPCHSECINLPGSFRCGACPPGYTGDGKYCRDINECADGNNGGCSKRPRVNCINTEGSSRCGRCPPGWTGDGRTCTEAKSNTCHGEQICHPRAQCEYISGTVVCSCPLGFFGHGYGADGCTEDSGRKPCDNHSCLNNGTCVLSGRGTTCICQPGYTGALCAEADDCHPNPCQNGGTCRLLPGRQHRCLCPAGYTGSTCSYLRNYCGRVLFNVAGSMQFPPSEDNSSSGYHPNERCAFIIRTWRRRVLNVTFGMFDLQPSDDCTKDYVQIHDGNTLTAPLIGRFCGHELPFGNGTLVSTQEQLFFWFRSDNATQARGFNLTWNSQELVCGEQLRLALGESGVLRSPSYPGKARPSLDCSWDLTAPFGTRLLLRFYEITLGSRMIISQSAPNCSNADNLSVRDADRQLYLACQSVQPAPLYSSSNLLNIHFHTDMYRSDSSFQLHYEVVAGHPGCGGVFTERSGVISGHMNADLCLYRIEQPVGTQIQLNFHQINLMYSNNCHLQKLEIFDGASDEEPLLRRYCGEPKYGELQPLISSSNIVLVRYEYKWAGLDMQKSFELRYSRVCIYNYTDGEDGIITTPNYPNPYLENVDCTFFIRGDLGKRIRINITDLSLSEMQPPPSETAELSINSVDQLNYLDVYLSRNESDKQRLFKNLTNVLLISHNNQARLVFHSAGNPQRGRGLRVEYSFINDACGGVLSTPSGRIPDRIFRRYCLWTIETVGRKHLHISFEMLWGAARLFIFDNSTGTEAKLLNTYNIGSSSEELQINEYTDSNLLTIIVSPYVFSSYSIYLLYEPAKEVCGGSSAARYGTIQSPNWPQKYGRLENCSWIIKAPLGSRIELIVQNFTLESTDACEDDYLEIRNGNQATSPLIGRYCGSHIPPRIPSYGNALHVYFRTDSLVQEAGFHLNWQMATAGCGGKLNSAVGAIHSPHSMDFNSGAVSCDWQIIVAQGSTVRIQLQSQDDVCNGQLTIYDGPTTRSSPMSLNCSSPGQSLDLASSSNRVLVRYNVPKESLDGIRFVLDYATNCRVRLEQLSGSIETPNFPDNYPANTNCEWDIRGGALSNRLQLIISHMAVERTDSGFCYYDYVLLADYRDDQLINESRPCSANHLDFTSEGNRLLISFRSDASQQAMGFRAEYKRLGCGGELLGRGGTFETPNAPYSIDFDCNWLITAPDGFQIRLLLREVHIETTLHDCSQDGLTVLPGGNSSHVLFRSCQVETNVQTLLSPANELRVHFHSSPQRARKYIKATYVMVPASCGGYVSVSNGVITSPGFYEPGIQIYDKDVECVWTIEVADTYGFLLNFEQFNLTDSPNCSLAVLELSSQKADNSGQFLERACGEKSPVTVLVQNKLRLHLQVSAGNWARFALQYRRFCGGTLSADEGYIRSRLDEYCYWTINGPEGSKISLNIYQLECPRCTAPEGNCTAGLRVINDEDGVEYFNLCQDHHANLIVPTNRVRIQTRGIVLIAQYTSMENSCGGNITSVRGTLSSPNYPESYPANVECVWLIEPRAGNALELNFEAMDLVESDHCNADFLEVRAGLLDSILGLYCGTELPAAPLIARGQVWLKFRSQPGSSANGFKLRWNYVHDQELTEGTDGIIESPPTLAVRGDDQPYSWRIFMERTRVLTLDFKYYSTGLQLFDGFDDSALAISIQPSPWLFTSSSNVIYLRTVNTDFDAFRLQWRVLHSESLVPNVTLKSKECNEVYIMDNSPIAIKSPGYPQGYKPNLNCEWTFKPSNPTQHVFVLLYDVRLEVMDQCSVDYLIVQSSNNLVDWQERLRMCNSSVDTGRPIQRIDGTPNLQLKFVTDATVNGTGFRSVVSTDCGSNMTGSVGTIVDSFFMRRPDSPCEWSIEVRPGRVIDFTIEYNGAPRNASCSIYGLINDGLDVGAPLLKPGKFCNQLGFATTSFRTSGPHAHIRYFMAPSTGIVNPLQNQWNLTYREFSECDGEVRLTHLASSYNISTPGYPYYPHPHTDCTWVIIAPPGETIAANFVDDFALSMRYCDQEYVELFDGSTTLARRLLRTCVRPGTTHSSGSLLLVHYQTQLNEPQGGFRLSVSLSSCGGQYNSASGIIKSEHYPALGAYSMPAVCEYIIKTPMDTQIQLNFSDLHLPFDGAEESIDRIELLDLTNQRQILITLFSNVSVPYNIKLATNELALRLVTVKTVHSYRGFQLQYMATKTSCFRDVTAASGDLEIYREQGQINRLRNCQWRITVPKGQRVRLELLNLSELIVSRTPRRSYFGHGLAMRKTFAFYNDLNQRSKIIDFELGAYSGNGIIESTDNFMLARFMLTSENVIVPFRARFSSNQSSPCPPNIGSQASGIVSNQELIDLPTYYCNVRFMAEPGVTLSFRVEGLLTPQTTITFYDYMGPTFISVRMSNYTVSMATTAGYIMLLGRPGGSQQRFRITYNRYSCGGQLSLTEGTTVELPPLSEHFGPLECVWMLQDSIGYELRGNVSFSDSCDREYLTLSTGRNLAETMLARICGEATEMNTTLLQMSNTKLTYHATQYRGGRSQFLVQASRPKSLGGWGNIIEVGMQPIPSIVVDAGSYRNNMELGWEFRAGSSISLRVVFQGRFFIELSPNCTNDYLQIFTYDLPVWKPIAKYCGRELPQPLHVPSSQMRIVFRTNGNITGDGFTFVVRSSCDAKLQASTEVQKFTHAPNVRGRWRSENCTFEITTDTKHQLLVSVKSKGRTSWSQLTCDLNNFEAYRQVADKEERIGNFCPNFEVSGYGRVRLNYIHKNSINRPFELQYQLIGCGGDYRAPFTLRPPIGETEGSYAIEETCEWHVTAPPQHAIFLRFKYFDIERTEDCLHDQVSIYRGTSLWIKEQSVACLCGNLSEPTVMVDSNQAVIFAKLSGFISSVGRGFLATVHFTPNCNERLRFSEGNTRMSLVRQYQVNGTSDNDLQCYFRAMASMGSRLSVWLKHLQLNAKPCERLPCNSLEVIDGFDFDSVSLGKYHSDIGNGTKLYSSTSNLLIKLSGSVAQPNGISFELILEMEYTVCGQLDYNLVSNETVNLRLNSDNISKNYEGSIHCHWHFTADDQIQIHINSVQLQGISQLTGKCIDYLLVKPELEHSKYYCGQFNNTVLDIPSGNFDITFHSNGQASMFWLDLSIKKKAHCNRTFNALNGGIQFYTIEADDPDNCVNYIRVPEGYSLTLEIMFLHFKFHTNQFFNMTDLRTNRSVYSVSGDNFISFETVHTNTNAIRLLGVGLRFLQLFYYATSNTLPAGCGGDLTALEGQFSNPAYDNRNYSDCSWRISVPAGNTLYLTFRTFNMGSESNCQLDNIKIYQIMPDNSEILRHTLCGSDPLEPLQANYNRLRIDAKKSPNFDGIGFQLSYSSTYE
ncbi:cubilin homolog isoform X2 [Drosophila grimshawi]|uniref:cubilin homolog isoform X2 n=1 Tax=Drosophila grimshawi TaxID=7222 RepID=UPI000C86F294|nr:cubilin homolog isoform X2 [Drosophila grimshawi]